LEGFTEGALDEYASARFSAHSFPPELLSTVYRTTGGNPLFVSTLFDDLENRKMVAIVDGVWELSARVSDVAARRPDSIRRLIDIQIDRLGATEQRVLEAASVAGQTFTAGVVAAALGLDVDEVDSCCESLTHDHQGLLYVGRETWPDGTIQSRYAFSHSLYQHAAFARSTAATVRVWHRRIGERLEAGYPERTDDVAAELAQHLDEGHAFAKAAHYYVLAAERAVRRHGNTEALGHFEKAQGLLARLPEGRERDEIELRLVDGLGPCLFTVKALAASNVVTVFERSADLARRIGDDRRLCTALLGLQRCRTLGGALREVGEHTPEVVTLATRLAEPDLVADAIFLSSRGEFLRGRFAEAREGFTRVRALVSQPREVVVSATGLFGLLEWLTGYPDAALRRGRESLELAEALGEPFALAQALCSLAFLHTWRREPAPALKCGQRALNLANDVPLAMWQSRAGAIVHWATSALNPATSELHVDQLLAQPWDAGPLGTALTAPTFIEVCARAGREAMALGRIAPVLAFMEQTDERVVEPEIHRLQGELAKATDPVEAERRFNAAIEIARRQSSRSFELRATLSLCRLLGGAKKRPGRAPERERALEDLRALLDTFTEGLVSGDLVEARALKSRP
jgi:tetratricopeptide (TPR) repeat protein